MGQQTLDGTTIFRHTDLYYYFLYGNKVFNTIISRHPNATTIISVNDPYSDAVSVKDSEHQKRGQDRYADGSKNVFMKAQDKFPSPREFSDLFKNKPNKIRLQEFLKKEFTKEVQHRDIKMIYSMKDGCWELGSGERRPELECSRAEADTILFYIYSQLRKLGIMDPVVLDGEDTDVVALSAKVAHEIEGELGIKRKKANIRLQEALRSQHGQNYNTPALPYRRRLHIRLLWPWQEDHHKDTDEG